MKNGMMKKLALALAMVLLLAAGAAQAEGNSIADVYERVSGAVVQVRNMAETWSPENGATIETALTATGVVLAEDFVLTNWHVVYEADYVEVETLDGQIVRARDIFTDDSLDLAVLKLEKPLTGVTPVTLGDSSALRVGDPAIVIGNLALEDVIFPATLTMGYISGLNRSSANMGNFTRNVPLIHTAPIPGCETENSRFFAEHGISISAHSIEEQICYGCDLAQNAAIQHEMQRRQSKNAHPDAAQRILALIEGRE